MDILHCTDAFSQRIMNTINVLEDSYTQQQLPYGNGSKMRRYECEKKTQSLRLLTVNR